MHDEKERPESGVGDEGGPNDDDGERAGADDLGRREPTLDAEPAPEAADVEDGPGAAGDAEHHTR